MNVSLAAASIGLAMQNAAPPLETAFIAALAAGDAPAAEAMLAEDATIMHEESGRPEPATAAAIAAFLRGCEGTVLIDVESDEPGRDAFTIGWSCGARGQTDMLLWTADGRVAWVQLGRLVRPEAGTAG